MSDFTKKDVWVERVLRIPIRPGDLPAPGSVDALNLGLDDYWAAAKAGFETAARSVDSQIAALQAALREEDDPELNEIGETGLNAFTRNTRVPLIAALMEADRGSEALVRTAPKLFAAAQSFLATIESDPRIEACDDNPFGVPVSIADTYGVALEGLVEVARAAMGK